MAGLLDYVFNSPEGRMGLGLFALGQMPKSQGMQGLMGLLASQDAAAKNKADSAWQEEARGASARSEPSGCRSRTGRPNECRKTAVLLATVACLALALWVARLPLRWEGAGVIPESPQVAPGGGKIKEWSEKLGIPQDAIVADYLQNGGKGIAEMLYRRGTPDMQVTNGYAYDKNKLGAGFMPSLSTSQDGKTSMVRIGQDGLPVVTSPQGALETYNAYQQAAASHKPIKVYNPQTGREEFTSEAAVVRPAQNFTGSGYSGGSSGSAAQEQRQIMEYELSRLPQGHPDRQALMREIARLPGGGSQAYAAGPSAQETADNEAARVKAVDTAKADVVRDTAQKGDSKKFAQMTSGLDRAIQLLEQQPTGSGVGAVVDKGLNAMGMSTRGGRLHRNWKRCQAGWYRTFPAWKVRSPISTWRTTRPWRAWWGSHKAD